ncbi:MAG: type II toxin-antitoxin system RatA family toxin [Marinicellaceae bacterium]
MHTINRQAIIRHNAEKMFDLVNSIETYPAFLNWCHESHILKDNDSEMIAGMTISLAGIKQKFTTRNILSKELKNYRIDLTLVSGPFKNLSGYWIFTPFGTNASKIELHLEFNFKSGLLNSTFKKAFGRIAQQLVVDFVERANNVYS